MKPQLMIAAALLTLGIVACNESTTEPTPQPTGETMQFKPGARYEYTTYSTDTAAQAPIESTRRTKTRTLIASNASVNGKAGVAVSLDSLFATAGGFLSVTDSVLLQQASGTNEIYRYASRWPRNWTSVGLLDYRWTSAAHGGTRPRLARPPQNGSWGKLPTPSRLTGFRRK